MDVPYNSVCVHLIDDKPVVTDALAWLLESVEIESYAHGSATAFLQALPEIRWPICAVLDLRMPEMNGLELQQRLIDEGYDIPLMFLTAYGDVPAAVNAIQFGAVDFMQKPFNPELFLAKINQIMRLACEKHAEHERQCALDKRLSILSKRETEVLYGVVDGLTSKEVARALGISPKTVDTHRSALMRKMNAASRAELIRMMR